MGEEAATSGNAGSEQAVARPGLALHQGMAAVGEWISAASFAGLAGTLYILGYDGLAFVLGWTGGFVLLGVLVAPYLGLSEARSVPDFLGQRFGSAAVRVLAALVVVVCSFIFLVAQLYGAGLVLARLTSGDFTIAVIIGLLGVLLSSVLADMKRPAWIGAMLLIVLLAAFLVVPVILSIKHYGLPLPQLTYGQALADIATHERDFIAQRLADVRALKPHAQPFANYDTLNFLGLILCLAAGTAAMPFALRRYLAIPSARDARFAVAWSLLFVFVLYLTAPAYAAFAKLEVYGSLIGRPLAALPEWIYTWGSIPDPGRPGYALINVCGKAATSAEALLANCGAGHLGVLRLQDLSIDPDVIAIATPEIAGMPIPVTLLVGAGAVIAALWTASALLITLAGAVSRKQDSAGWRGRGRAGALLFVLAVAALAAWAALHKPASIVSMAAWSFSLAAAGLFPALVLGIWWKRATPWGCVAGIAVGFGIAIYYLIGTRYFAVAFFEMWNALSSASSAAVFKFSGLKQAWVKLAEGPAREAAWLALDAHAQTIANWWGVRNIAAGLFGLPAGFVTILLISLATKAPAVPRGR